VVDAPVLKVGRAIRPGERVPGWIRVADDTVSRLHCELFWQEDRHCFRLLHRSATNSTYLNGEEVDDAEVFDGDLIEVGATTLEVQKADLRWSKAEDPSVQDWAPQSTAPIPSSLETKPMEGLRQIPGATVPVTAPSNRRMTIGPQLSHVLETEDGTQYVLKGSRIRFGSSAPPYEETEEGEEEPKPRVRFDTEYVLEDQSYSYYNLVLNYDEIVQDFKAASIGPNAQKIRILRKQSGLVWQAELPEGVEVSLMEGDYLRMGNLVLIYKKEGKS
jgi:FHA domain